jgi:hypothetical protein
MSPELAKAIKRAQRDLDRLVAEGAAQDDPAHEHEWWELDKSRHCFKCGVTEHEPYPAGLGGPA